MILSRPGTSIRCIVESTKDMSENERVYVELRVMDRGDRSWVDGLQELNITPFEMARRCLGRLITSIEGLKTAPNEPWEIAKDSDGYLTNESAEFLIPLHPELIEMISKGATLTNLEKKTENRVGDPV